MNFSLSTVLLRLTIVPVAVAAIIGLLRFRKLPTSLRYVAKLNWFELPLELLGMVLSMLHQNNLFIMPIYTVGEFGLLALAYSATLRSVTFKRWLPWLISGFAVYALLDSLLVNDLTRFRPGQQIIQSLLILGLVGLYFRKLLHELRVAKLEREPMFWVSIGLTFYFLGYLQLALFSNYLLHYSQQLVLNAWIINSLLSIMLHCCYCYALWMRPQR